MLAINEHHYYRLIDMTALVKTRDYKYESGIEEFSYNGCDIRVSHKGDSKDNHVVPYGVNGYGFSVERSTGTNKEDTRQTARQWADCFAQS